MISKIFDNIVDKIGTLVDDNSQWTSKPGKNVFI
jgi:hypothetical protein